jgi:hypothetical protein
MKLRILSFCPRCGYNSFRPSISRIFRDSFLGKLGICPHRCYTCRLRFYLFKPDGLRALVEALDRPMVDVSISEERPVSWPVQATNRARAMVARAGDLMRQ